MEQKAEACYKERKNAWIHTLERAKAMRYGLFVGGEGGGNGILVPHSILGK